MYIPLHCIPVTPRLNCVSICLAILSAFLDTIRISFAAFPYESTPSHTFIAEKSAIAEYAATFILPKTNAIRAIVTRSIIRMWFETVICGIFLCKSIPARSVPPVEPPDLITIPSPSPRITPPESAETSTSSEKEGMCVHTSRNSVRKIVPKTVFTPALFERSLKPRVKRTILAIIFVTERGTDIRYKSIVPIPLTPPVDSLTGARQTVTENATKNVPSVKKMYSAIFPFNCTSLRKYFWYIEKKYSKHL